MCAYQAWLPYLDPQEWFVLITEHCAAQRNQCLLCQQCRAFKWQSSSAKIGMHMKGCMLKVQGILIWLGACRSYKLVGTLITEYFFYWFPLHASVHTLALLSSAFLSLPSSPLLFTFFLCFRHNKFTYIYISTHLEKTACNRHTKRRNGLALTCCTQGMTSVRNGTLKTSFLHAAAWLSGVSPKQATELHSCKHQRVNRDTSPANFFSQHPLFHCIMQMYYARSLLSAFLFQAPSI